MTAEGLSVCVCLCVCVGGGAISQTKRYCDDRGSEKVPTKGVILPINMLRTLKGTTIKKPGWEERNVLEGIVRKYSEKLRMRDTL